MDKCELAFVHFGMLTNSPLVLETASLRCKIVLQKIALNGASMEDETKQAIFESAKKMFEKSMEFVIAGAISLDKFATDLSNLSWMLADRGESPQFHHNYAQLSKHLN